MRFTEFSLPESTFWMEKSDILFLLDCENHETPFVSRAIIGNYMKVSDNPYETIIERIHPEDLKEFKNVITGHSSRPAHHKLRIIDNTNRTRLFSFHKLRVATGKRLLLAISKRTYTESLENEYSVSG